MSDGPDPEPARPPALVERLLPPVDPLGEDGHPKPSRMDQREQLVAAGLGFANVAITAGTAAGMESQQGWVMLAGLLAAALTVVGARMGNRMLGMIGLFSCTLVRPGSTAIFLAVVLPYYAAGVWMLIRYNRLTKVQNIRRRQERLEARRRGQAKDGRPAPRAAGRGGGGGATAKPRPSPSKRYTPPKVRKRPPPSKPAKPPADRSIVD